MHRVAIESDREVVVLRLNRPEVLGGIDQAMCIALLGAIPPVEVDPSVRECLLTGGGPGFCSGAGQLDAYPRVRALQNTPPSWAITLYIISGPRL